MSDAADADPFPASSADAHEAGSTLGPLEDLEDHVPVDWWRTLFGPTYLLTDSGVLTDDRTRAEVDGLVERLALQPSDCILDLCCGQGRHTLELARRGFEHVQGFDRSAFLIEQARAAASEENLSISFQQGDCRELPFEDGAFDAVLLLGNSFGYFEAAEDDRAVLTEVRRVLRPERERGSAPGVEAGGRVLLDLTDGAHMRRHFEPRSWEWIDEEHLACRERELAADGRRLVSREIVVHVEQGVLADQFYAERLYDRSQITALLAAAGFAAIDAAGTLEAKPEPGLDLGMMARRLLVTARPGGPAPAGGDGAAGGYAAPPPRHVAVVLGDPRRPDALKLGGVFDADDFDVIDRLREALAALDGFQFTCLDDHGALFEDLRALQGDVDLVLNLCDEGFNNDPRKELHVPALLELLALPYTGGGPQCLAHCYDKSLVRGVARELGVPVAEACLLAPGEAAPDDLGFPFPVIVKPNAADSSVGITQKSVAHDASQLAAAVAGARVAVGDRPLLIEAFLTGADLSIGLIGNGDTLTALPVTAENYDRLPKGLPELCGYEAKWLPDSPYYMGEGTTVRAELPAATRDALEAYSRRLFARLGCRDYARFDWRLDADGRPYLLEVNPNPGWCYDGHLAVQASLAGASYSDLLRGLLDAATQRLSVAGADA